MHRSHASTALDGAGSRHEHIVEFYETTAFLVGTVADFVVPALRGNDAVILVATPEHLAAFATAIAAEGIDLDAAIAAYDAAELLARYMTGGMPDPARFEQVACAALDRAAASGRDVKVYGEMVALLWADGDVDATIALEDLWNDLAATRSFALLCGYPLRDFDDDARAAFKRICTQHTAAVTSLPALVSDPLQVAELRQAPRTPAPAHAREPG